MAMTERPWDAAKRVYIPTFAPISSKRSSGAKELIHPIVSGSFDWNVEALMRVVGP